MCVIFVLSAIICLPSLSICTQTSSSLSFRILIPDSIVFLLFIPFFLRYYLPFFLRSSLLTELVLSILLLLSLGLPDSREFLSFSRRIHCYFSFFLPEFISSSSLFHLIIFFRVHYSLGLFHRQGQRVRHQRCPPPHTLTHLNRVDSVNICLNAYYLCMANCSMNELCIMDV